MGFSDVVSAGAIIFPLRPLCGFLAACAAAFASAAAFFSSSLLAFFALDFIREKSAMVSMKHKGLWRSGIAQVKTSHSKTNNNVNVATEHKV